MAEFFCAAALSAPYPIPPRKKQPILNMASTPKTSTESTYPQTGNNDKYRAVGSVNDGPIEETATTTKRTGRTEVAGMSGGLTEDEEDGGETTGVSGFLGLNVGEKLDIGGNFQKLDLDEGFWRGITGDELDYEIQDFSASSNAFQERGRSRKDEPFSRKSWDTENSRVMNNLSPKGYATPNSAVESMPAWSFPATVSDTIPPPLIGPPKLGHGRMESDGAASSIADSVARGISVTGFCTCCEHDEQAVLTGHLGPRAHALHDAHCAGANRGSDYLAAAATAAVAAAAAMADVDSLELTNIGSGVEIDPALVPSRRFPLSAGAHGHGRSGEVDGFMEFAAQFPSTPKSEGIQRRPVGEPVTSSTVNSFSGRIELLHQQQQQQNRQQHQQQQHNYYITNPPPNIPPRGSSRLRAQSIGRPAASTTVNVPFGQKSTVTGRNGHVRNDSAGSTTDAASIIIERSEIADVGTANGGQRKETTVETHIGCDKGDHLLDDRLNNRLDNKAPFALGAFAFGAEQCSSSQSQLSQSAKLRNFQDDIGIRQLGHRTYFASSAVHLPLLSSSSSSTIVHNQGRSSRSRSNSLNTTNPDPVSLVHPAEEASAPVKKYTSSLRQHRHRSAQSLQSHHSSGQDIRPQTQPQSRPLDEHLNLSSQAVASTRPLGALLAHLSASRDRLLPTAWHRDRERSRARERQTLSRDTGPSSSSYSIAATDSANVCQSNGVDNVAPSATNTTPTTTTLPPVLLPSLLLPLVSDDSGNKDTSNKNQLEPAFSAASLTFPRVRAKSGRRPSVESPSVESPSVNSPSVESADPVVFVPVPATASVVKSGPVRSGRSVSLTSVAPASASASGSVSVSVLPSSLSITFPVSSQPTQNNNSDPHPDQLPHATSPSSTFSSSFAKKRANRKNNSQDTHNNESLPAPPVSPLQLGTQFGGAPFGGFPAAVSALSGATAPLVLSPPTSPRTVTSGADPAAHRRSKSRPKSKSKSQSNPVSPRSPSASSFSLHFHSPPSHHHANTLKKRSPWLSSRARPSLDATAISTLSGKTPQTSHSFSHTSPSTTTMAPSFETTNSKYSGKFSTAFGEGHPHASTLSIASKTPTMSSQASASASSEGLLSKPFMLRNGRMYINDATIPYPLPVDLTELHRESLRTLLLIQLFRVPVCCPSLSKKPPTKVLEIGCGSGFWSMMCHRYFKNLGHPGILFTGLDISPLAPSSTSGLRRPDQDMKWRFVQHDLRSMPLPFADEEFDLIMVKDMSLAITNSTSQRLMDEYLRILAPGGVIEMWESDHTIRMLRPQASVSNDYEGDKEPAIALGAYVMTPNTPLSSALNKYIVEYNAWITKVLEARDLPAVPCTFIGPSLLQESEILCDIKSRRLAVPLSDLRWEKEGVGGVGLSSSSLSSRSGKKKSKGLSPGQLALRETALMTVVQKIVGLEGVLREVSGKSRDEWDMWVGRMMADLLTDAGAGWGECLEIGAWWARKRE